MLYFAAFLLGLIAGYVGCCLAGACGCAKPDDGVKDLVRKNAKLN